MNTSRDQTNTIQNSQKAKPSDQMQAPLKRNAKMHALLRHNNQWTNETDNRRM